MRTLNTGDQNSRFHGPSPERELTFCSKTQLKTLRLSSLNDIGRVLIPEFILLMDCHLKGMQFFYFYFFENLKSGRYKLVKYDNKPGERPPPKKVLIHFKDVSVLKLSVCSIPLVIHSVLFRL